MNPQDFFQNIIIHPEPQQQDPPYLQHNTVMLEIANNWPFVRWTMDRYRHGDLNQIDQMEQLWLNYFVGNNLDIEIYKNEQDFLLANMKPVPE